MVERVSHSGEETSASQYPQTLSYSQTVIVMRSYTRGMRETKEIILRMDEATARALYQAHTALGEHIAAGVPIPYPVKEENAQLASVLTDLGHQLGIKSMAEAMQASLDHRQRGTPAVIPFHPPPPPADLERARTQRLREVEALEFALKHWTDLEAVRVELRQAEQWLHTLDQEDPAGEGTRMYAAGLQLALSILERAHAARQDQ